jgi:hypothetical protein
MSELPKGWVPQEIFEEHLKLFSRPCLDLLIDIPGQGIVWVKRKNPPMLGMYATPGVRVQVTEKSWEEAIERVAKDEVRLEIDPEKCQFVDQQIVRFEKDKDGIERTDTATCWVIKVVDNNGDYCYYKQPD